MKRSLMLVLSILFLAATLGGCACAQKEVKSEPPPPAQVQKTTPPPEPMPAKPVPPKKDRN
jgi:hypothetical protein